MTNVTETTCSTKANAMKDTVAVETKLSLNWEGMTPEDIRALAQQALIVKLQGGWRKNGIPTEATVNVVDHKIGTRAPKGKPDLAALFAAMTADERAAFLAKVTA